MWKGGYQQWGRLPVPQFKQACTSRLYSVVSGPAASEDVQVTCGSSGFVKINIYNKHLNNGTTIRPLVIYITPLPSLEDPNKLPSPVPKALLNGNTVVQINPRWSPTHLFPTPLHDTLRAYNWILENLLNPERHSSHTSSSGGRRKQCPIAVYGTDLGGTLATSLALTESHKPSVHKEHITALAVKNAIFNWSTIVTTSPPPLASPSSSSHTIDADLSRLYALRGKLFRNPSSAFDAFASPLLFFRTMGLATPASFPATKAEEEASRVEGVGVLGGQYVSKKSHLTFPPKGSGLRIPVTRIAVLENGGGGGDVGIGREEEVVESEGVKDKGKRKRRSKDKGKNETVEGENGVFREQAEEMVKLMRRSVTLHEGKERHYDGFDGAAEAERRVALVELSRPQEGQADDGEWAAEFFEDILIKSQN